MTNARVPSSNLPCSYSVFPIPKPDAMASQQVVKIYNSNTCTQVTKKYHPQLKFPHKKYMKKSPSWSPKLLSSEGPTKVDMGEGRVKTLKLADAIGTAQFSGQYFSLILRVTELATNIY